MELGIVILNYLNWTDTVECVESLKGQTHQDYQIVIVDNASANESFSELTARYEGHENIHLLQTDKNLGFAKGNNTGIVYCKEILNLFNILMINNDVIFTEPDYLAKLVNYEVGQDIGVIGTKIIGSDGKNQNPHYFNPSFRKVMREFTFPLLRKYHLNGILEVGRFLKHKGKPVPQNTEAKSLSTQTNKSYVLHGAVMYLTENYLNQMNGLYPETFLYYEEEILGLVCKKLNLKMRYVEDISIYHKEDQSSEMSFQNLESVKYGYARKSVRTGLKVSIMSVKSILTKTNEYPYKFKVIHKKDEQAFKLPK